MKQLEKSEKQLYKQIQQYYKNEAKALQQLINDYYTTYGVNNVIEYRQLLQSLSTEQVNLLIRDIDSFVAEYPQYAHLAPVRTSIYKLDRLEGLQTSVKLESLRVGAYEQSSINDHLSSYAVKFANATAEAMGFGSNFYTENVSVIKAMLSSDWANGSNFSERIWNNIEKLTETLNNEIATGFARGTNYRELSRILSKKMDSSAKQAFRLIYTEGSRVMNEAVAIANNDDEGRYYISTVGDGKVCDYCADMMAQSHKQEWLFKNREAGVNYPPFHTSCRCTIDFADVWE